MSVVVVALHTFECSKCNYFLYHLETVLACFSGSDDEDVKTKRKRAKKEAKRNAKQSAEAQEAVGAEVRCALLASPQKIATQKKTHEILLSTKWVNRQNNSEGVWFSIKVLNAVIWSISVG